MKRDTDRKSSRQSDRDSTIPQLSELLEKFQSGLRRQATNRSVHIDEVISEATIAFFEAKVGFIPSRGQFSRRWWFYLLKRIVSLSPKHTDALAHLIDIDVGDVIVLSSEED